VIDAGFVSNKEETVMYILMVGSPDDGFELFGPFASEEAATPAVRHFWRWDHVWVFELRPPDQGGVDTAGVEAFGEDPNGGAVVFAGSITGDPQRGEGWIFFGPLKNLDAAREWAGEDGLGNDCAIALRPVKELELELELETA
jgi:hypothetical protein